MTHSDFHLKLNKFEGRRFTLVHVRTVGNSINKISMKNASILAFVFVN